MGIQSGKKLKNKGTQKSDIIKKTLSLETEKKKTASEKREKQIKEFVEAVVVAFIAAIILRIFVIQAFRIPTGSMKDTLLVGDFLLVNKFIYGVRTPDRLPLINKEIPFLRMPAFKNPERGNIIVFKYPEDESLDYIKRCIAEPGQTIEVKSGEVFVDGKPEGELTKMQRQVYDVEAHQNFDYYRVKTTWGDDYVIRQLSDYYISYDNYGPVRVPRKGDVIQFPLRNEDEWKAFTNLIKREKNRFSYLPGSNQVYINGEPVTSYTVKDDYYFMMGDNRDNSSDSRDWGFLPYRNIVGEALLIYFSWDGVPDWSHFYQKIRWGRIGGIIR
ncbi:signal peptidase I [candidate division KSB1 bacterium]|nr:signal peptidase I [candidate division KSB1 bacterium]